MTPFKKLESELNDLLMGNLVTSTIRRGPNNLFVDFVVGDVEASGNGAASYNIPMKNGDSPIIAIMRYVTTQPLHIATKIAQSDIKPEVLKFLDNAEALRDIVISNRKNYEHLLGDISVVAKAVDIYQVDSMKLFDMDENLMAQLSLKASSEAIEKVDKLDLFKKVATVYVPKSGELDDALDAAFCDTQNLHHSWGTNPNVDNFVGARSSSVGDVFVMDGKAHAVCSFGFTEIENFSHLNPAKKALERTAPSATTPSLGA